MNGIKMLWFFHLSFFCFFFLEWTVRKDIWMRTTSVTVIVIFWKRHSERYLIIAMFKVCSQQLRVISTTEFRKAPYSWRFVRHGLTYVLILSWANMNQNSKKLPGKLSVAQKFQPDFDEYCTKIEDISLTFIHLFFSPRNLVFKFDLVLIEWFSPQFLYLLTFRLSFNILRILKFNQRLCEYSFLQVYSCKMILSYSYFLWNIRTY